MNNQDDFFKIFGRIATLYSNLDFFITLILNRLISDNESISSTITTGISSLSAKIRLSEQFIDTNDLDNTLKLGLVSFYKDASKFRNKRNRFIHDMWLLDPELLSKGTVGRRDIKDLLLSGFKANYIIENLKDLEDFADSLAILISRAIDIYSKMPGKKPVNIKDHTPLSDKP